MLYHTPAARSYCTAVFSRMRSVTVARGYRRIPATNRAFCSFMNHRYRLIPTDCLDSCPETRLFSTLFWILVNLRLVPVRRLISRTLALWPAPTLLMYTSRMYLTTIMSSRLADVHKSSQMAIAVRDSRNSRPDLWNSTGDSDYHMYCVLLMFWHDMFLLLFFFSNSREIYKHIWDHV